MSALSKILRNWRNPDNGDEGLTFFCPGCGDHHSIRTKGATAWGWNGDVEKPTFTPSVLVRSGHYVPGRDKDGCWCTYNAEREAKGEKPSKFKCEVCHSFVKDGQMQFLSDCTHALAGQTVPLPEWTEDGT